MTVPSIAGMQPTLVEIRLLTGLDRSLTYGVPSALRGRVYVGSLVRVPLRGRSVMGVVERLGGDSTVPEEKLKYILDCPYDTPVLSTDLLTLATWIGNYYAAGMEQVFETMIPAAVRKGVRAKVTRWLKPGRPPGEEEWGELQRRAPRQATVLAFIRDQGQALSRQVVLTRLKASASVIDALIEKRLLIEDSQVEHREAYQDDIDDDERVSPQPFALNDEQAAALVKINASIDQSGYATHLLHGVTGSGKTEVYLQAIRHTLALGGSVAFLVPEVALTPQTVSRLRARLADTGTRVVVWHSHLSSGERYDGWLALASGEARVVVGARSAIFAPLRDLRLIVVDEEHEPAYKQEEMPRYHGRDVAVYRAMLNRAVCVLGSATPSLESLYNVEQGKYTLSRIEKRIDDRRLPTLHVVDMKSEFRATTGIPVLSRRLVEALRERLERKEQAILFLNRRGFFKSMLCPDCGYVAECPHCSVSMTYHRTDDRLHCHLCGHSHRAPSRCPKCGSKKIKWRGHGTQRVEDLVAKAVPGARIMRMDTDSMSKKHLFRRILSDFRQGKLDILIGTQMIAKGLDFPNVTLVGLIDADLSLHIPDFRANERTFQLLVQVAGRAGRGQVAGEVIAQSFQPESMPIRFAQKADFDGFLREELEQRREFNYPPFRHIIRHLFRGRNRDKVEFFAEQWVRRLEDDLQASVEIRGPAPAPLEKIKDYYRFQIWYFVAQVNVIVPQLMTLRQQFKCDPDVEDVLDVDPVDLA